MIISRYLDTFVRSRVGGRLAALRIFPNAKEVTESFAARAAADRFRTDFPPGDPDIDCVVVGDGSTPRTAATFAMHSNWRCHSVDPRLRSGLHRWLTVPRLSTYRARIEDCRFRADRLVLVAVHSHVGLAATLRSIEAEELLIIAMPCCFRIDLECPPAIVYEDPDVLSPHRTIHLWRFSITANSRPE